MKRIGFRFKIRLAPGSGSGSIARIGYERYISSKLRKKYHQKSCVIEAEGKYGVNTARYGQNFDTVNCLKVRQFMQTCCKERVLVFDLWNIILAQNKKICLSCELRVQNM